MNEHTLEDIHNYIEECRKELKTKVSWQVMGIIMTLIIAVIGWIIASQVRQTDNTDKSINRVSNVEGDLKAVNVGIGEIKGTLIRLENKLDRRN